MSFCYCSIGAGGKPCISRAHCDAFGNELFYARVRQKTTKKDPRCKRPEGSVMADICMCPYCSGYIPPETNNNKEDNERTEHTSECNPLTRGIR